MKKINIIKKNIEFQRIMEEKNLYKNQYFLIFIRPKKETYYRIGISVPKKIEKAVIRNKIKRQLKDIIDNTNLNKNFDYVIIVKQPIVNIEYKIKEKMLLELLYKIGEKNG